MELPDRDAHEAEFARRIGRDWDQRRRELNRMLTELDQIDGQPNLDLIPEEHWEEHRKKDETHIALLLYLMMQKSAAIHLDQINAADRWHAAMASPERTVSTLANVEPVIAAQAQRRGAEIAAAKDRRNREALRIARENGQLGTLPDIRTTTMRIYGPSQVAETVITNVTHGRTIGAETVVSQTVGLSPDDLWLTVYGSGTIDKRVCPVCYALNRTPRTYWARFFPEGPPAHPRCRCDIDHKHTQPNP